jgi:hypothetical protein
VEESRQLVEVQANVTGDRLNLRHRTEVQTNADGLQDLTEFEIHVKDQRDELSVSPWIIRSDHERRAGNDSDCGTFCRIVAVNEFGPDEPFGSSIRTSRI